MTAVPELTHPPQVTVMIYEHVPDPDPCEWTGTTKRMRPNAITVHYDALLGAAAWWVHVLLGGPSVRKDGTDGRVTAHQVYLRDDEEDSLQHAPGWVREFVRVNEPPAYMRGA